MKERANIAEQNVLEFLYDLAKTNRQIEFLEFATLNFAPSIEKRFALSSEDQAIVTEGLHLRSSLNLPFWDGVMLSASRTDVVPEGVLKAATFHQSLPRELLRIPAASVTLDGLNTLSSAASKSGKLLVLTSLVADTNGERHLRLLDFHCAYSASTTALVGAVIDLLGCHGTLLSSGKSYHFYGDPLLNGNDLRRFLGHALLFEPIVDRAWIAHQLIEGCCALRVSDRPEYGGPPVVIQRC